MVTRARAGGATSGAGRSGRAAARSPRSTRATRAGVAAANVATRGWAGAHIFALSDCRPAGGWVMLGAMVVPESLRPGVLHPRVLRPRVPRPRMLAPRILARPRALGTEPAPAPRTSGRHDAPTAAALADPATFPPLDPHRGPWPGREVTAGGVTLHVRETPGPDGCPAVYVHGLGGSAKNWTDLSALLSTRAAGTAVDLPGFGRSRPPAGFDFTPAAHADALLCFLAGRNEPVHLLGNSFGGAIALSVAARRPELVRTLTLVSPGDARPPAGPAPDGGRAARAGADPRPDRGPRAGGARRRPAPRAGRAGGAGVLRRPDAGAGAPARRGGRGHRRTATAWPGRRRRASGPRGG